jgi:DNA-directed RNA polymerase subunit beta'
MKEDNLFKNIIDFKGLKIRLASPEEILSWSHGEVIRPETINYRTWRPEKDGLFCERIFGPTKDWECYCGKYRKIRFRGVICDKCGVEVTHSRVRRERMGHISLAVPVVHIWFLKNNPPPLTIILGIPQKELEAVIYFARYLVMDVDKSAIKSSLENLRRERRRKLAEIEAEKKEKIKRLSLEEKGEIERLRKRVKNKDQFSIAKQELAVGFKQRRRRIEESALLEKERINNLSRFLREKIKTIDPLTTLSEEEYFYLVEFNANGFLRLGMGSEAVLEMLKRIDMKKLAKQLRGDLKKTKSRQKKKKIVQKLRVVEGMLREKIHPEWMVLSVLPVIPPELRPMVQLTGGRFATSDLNDLYRRVINRNNRLKRLISLGAPEIILRNEKRMLQEAVDMLIDATKGNRRASSGRRRLPRSLSDLLRGKKGRFRKNLLGKRVDYSGRSVIVVGPELRLDECGLPKEIALEIFRPFILRELMLRGIAPNIKSAKSLLDHKIDEVYDILEEVVKGKWVLLNRAPTLHKLSIQAFKPILVDSLSIRLHPCVCSGYNADFDGDQMGVFLPLSGKAQKEARRLMASTKNLLKPADASPTNVPTKEIVVGCYFATSIQEEYLDMVNRQPEEVAPSLKSFSSFEEAVVFYHSGNIKLRQLVAIRNKGKWILTTPGRILFNQLLPEGMPFVNESVNSKVVKRILDEVFSHYSRKEYVDLVDKVKDFGFWGMTASGISLAIFDCGRLGGKEEILQEAERKVKEIENNYNEGLITDREREQLKRDVWLETTEEIASVIWDSMETDSPMKLISNAGVKRVSRDQIKQISGMRGLIVDPLGRIVPLPTKSNFREGLSVFEYVTGARGSRKGLTDTALKTADAGYLTRRLVDVAHSCLVREKDCGTTKGLEITNEGERANSFHFRILGRYLSKPVRDPKTGKVLIKKLELIDEEKANLIVRKKIKSVWVRSPLMCRTHYGVCQHCYGQDLSNRREVKIGTPVGVIAAQSIGEPGTQLTLRTKHSGGVIGLDVTQGLPRVQELFEVRTPKALSPLADISGKVRIEESSEGYRIKITGKKDGEEAISEFFVPQSGKLLVKDGDLVTKGTQLAAGALDVKEVARIKGIEEAQRYLVDEVQKVYESQGISIHDKHFEIIVREMCSKVKVVYSGDTTFLVGSYIDMPLFISENESVKKNGGKPAKGSKVILGITQTALHTSSWLSAASFQETTNILTEVSVLGKEDKLIGLKENVIIGRLIPTDPKRVIID